MLTQAIARPLTAPLARSPLASKAQRSYAFRVAALYAAGAQGAWWSANDLATLFSDAAGTTPAVVGGVVMKQLDKSGRGNHRTNSVSGTSPILRQRSDGIYYLDYTGGKTLSVPSSTGLFNYLHDGTGGTIAAFLEWEQSAVAGTYLFSASSSAQVGIQIIKNAASKGVSLSVFRGTGGVSTGNVSAARFALSEPARMLRTSYKNNGTAADFKASVDGSLTVTNAPTLNAPAAGAAGTNLTVSTAFNSFEYEAVIREGELSESQVAMLYAYMRRFDYPVPSSVDLTLLLGGQSNMAGRGTLTTTSPEEKLVGVYSYTRAEEFRIATIPEHSLVNRSIATSPDDTDAGTLHGFALRAAKKLKIDAGKNVLLVPCAVSNTSIAQWDTPATKNDRTTLFGAMAYRYRQASVKAGTPIIVWYGHETGINAVPDFTNGGVGTAYQTALAQLWADVRSEIVSAPLIFVQLSSDDTLATAELLAAAGEAQRQLELSVPNAFMVVAHDVERNPSTDDIHVSRAGVDVIADRVALAIRQHVLGELVNGTGPRIVGATHLGAIVTLTCNKAINASGGNYGNLFRVYAGGVEQTVSSAVRNADTMKIDITCSGPLAGAVTLTYGYRAGAANAARTDFVMDGDGMPLPLFGPIVATP